MFYGSWTAAATLERLLQVMMKYQSGNTLDIYKYGTGAYVRRQLKF